MSLNSWTYIASGGSGPPYGALHYTEYEESGDGSLSQEDSEVGVTYQVDDQYRIDFMDDLLGTVTYANEVGGDYTLVRDLPEQHPEFDNFYANTAKYKRLGLPSNVVVNTQRIGRWKISRIDTRFKPPDYAVVADNALPTMTYTDPTNNTDYTAPDESMRFTSWRYNYVVQQLTVQGIMQFVTRTVKENKALPSSPGFASVFTELEVTWHKVPARTLGYDFWRPPNETWAYALAGMLNSDTFLDHAPGTVLFVGYQPKQGKPNLDTGLYTWDIVYRFLIKDDGLADVGRGVEAIGPNFIYDTQFRRYDLITATGKATGPTIYQEADLNALFAIRSTS